MSATKKIVEMANSKGTVLRESNLAELLADSKVRDCTQWKDIGLELNLSKSCLDCIERDQSYRTKDCIREMLYTWLTQTEDPTLEDLYAAIKKVKDRKARQNRKTHREQAKDDGKMAVDAIDEVKRGINTWQKRNETLYSDLTALIDEATDEQKWTFELKKWDRENEEWKQGGIARRRNEILNDIRLQNYLKAAFIAGFLKKLGFEGLFKPLEQQLVVECKLRQELADIDIKRTKVLIPRYKIVKQHRKQLEQLHTEIDQTHKLLNYRLTQHKEIITNLDHLGKNLSRLKNDLRSLQDKVDKCQKTKADCSGLCTKEEQYSKKMKQDLHEYQQSIDANLVEMTRKASEYLKILARVIEVLKGTSVGAVAGAGLGAGTGAAIGTIVPGFGTLIGAGIGALVGASAGALIGTGVGLHKMLKRMEEEQSQYRTTLQRTSDASTKLKEVLES